MADPSVQPTERRFFVLDTVFRGGIRALLTHGDKPAK